MAEVPWAAASPAHTQRARATKAAAIPTSRGATSERVAWSRRAEETTEPRRTAWATTQTVAARPTATATAR